MNQRDPFDKRSPYETLEHARRQRMIMSLTGAMIPSMGLVVLAFVIILLRRPSWQVASATGMCCLVIVCCVVARGLARRGKHPAVAGYTILITFLIATAINGVLIGGLYPAVAPAFTIIIVIAGMIMGPVGGFTIGGLAVGIWFAAYSILRAGLVEPVPVPPTLLTVVMATIVILTFLFTAYTSHLATQDLRRALEEATFDLVGVNRALQSTTTELQRSKERVEAILNNSPDAILLLRPQGIVESCNPAFSRLFGYDAHEMNKWSILSLVHPDYEIPLQDALRKVRQAEKALTVEVSARRKDGTLFDASFALAPVHEDGFLKGVVCSIRDISPLKEIERMKDAFVSNVSHELRTPVTSLKLNLKLLELSPEKQSTYVEKLGRDTDRLSNIIEDLLDLSRLEQDRLRVEVKSVNLNVLASQHVQDRTALAQARSITLTYQGAPGLPPVAGDEQLLEQILSVLLTNALNYTQPGGAVEVRTFGRVEGDTPWVGFSVRDDGPGISPQDQAHLFERFYRGSAGVKSGFPGTGLGLAIAREIVERHAGHIEVKSSGVPGEGATFTVWLPVVEPFA
jgi:two-component system phosphate regulon sensor histidine kinase PhoR